MDSDNSIGKAVILGWNLSTWDNWDPPYEDWVAQTARGEKPHGRWSVAHVRNIPPGTDAYLLLQGPRRGLVGHGVTTHWPELDTHHSDPGKASRHVRLDWDALLPLDSAIPREVLERDVPGIKWGQIYFSGKSVPAESIADLRNLWDREIGQPGDGAPS